MPRESKRMLSLPTPAMARVKIDQAIERVGRVGAAGSLVEDDTDCLLSTPARLQRKIAEPAIM